MLQGLKNKAIRFLLERTCPDVFTIKAMLSKVTRERDAVLCRSILLKERGLNMKIKTVYTSSLCPDAVFMALEIIKRMGWCHDEPDENGDMLVSIPIEDEHLFDFLDNCLFG